MSESSTSGPPAGPPLHLIVPTAIGAVVRAVHLGSLAARDPLFLHPVADSWFHFHEATLVLDHDVLLSGIGAFYKGPLYSYLLAVLIAIFGPEGAIVAGRCLSVLSGTVAVYLVALVADRLAGRRAAWIAGMTAALYGTAVYLDAALLDVSLVAALLLGSAALLLRASRDAEPSRALCATGLLLGLASISRTNGLLPLAAAAAYAALRARGGAWPRIGPARALMLVALPAAVVIAPVTFRNAVLERDPVLISWNGGINLFMGNDPGFDPAGGNWTPAITWTRLIRTPEDLGTPRGADHQRFFVGQAVTAALSDPIGAVGRVGTKVLLLFSGFEISNEQRTEDARHHSPLLAALMPFGSAFGLPFLLVWPVIAGGLVLACSRRVAGIAPPLVLAGAWALTPVLFFNTDRYRLAAILLTLPVGTAGIARAAGSWRDVSRRERFAALGTAAVFAVVGYFTIPARPTLPPSELFYLSTVAERRADLPAALDFAEQAVREDGEDVTSRLRLADLLMEAKRFDDAYAHYRVVAEARGLAVEWNLSGIHGLARASFEDGRTEESLEWMQRYLAADPDRPRTGTRPDFHLAGVPPLAACGARLELADVLVRLGRTEDGRAEMLGVARDCAASPRISALARKRAGRLASPDRAGAGTEPAPR